MANNNKNKNKNKKKAQVSDPVEKILDDARAQMDEKASEKLQVQSEEPKSHGNGAMASHSKFDKFKKGS